jgi:hypothetical protein
MCSNSSATSGPTWYPSAEMLGPRKTWTVEGSSKRATVFATIPSRSPRQPACATLMRVVASSTSNTGTQSATKTAIASSVDDAHVGSANDVAAVDLANDDQSMRVDVDGTRDSPSVLANVLGPVADVLTQIERLVGAHADTAESIGDEGVDPESAHVGDRVDAEGPSHLGRECYFSRHEGQIPLSSSTWRRSW